MIGRRLLAMVKLRQRAIVVVSFCAMCVTLVAVHMSSEALQKSQGQSLGSRSVGEGQISHDNPPKLSDSWELLRGHLRVMRKDLDLSGYNESGARPDRIRAYLDANPILQSLAPDILELADYFKDKELKDDLVVHPFFNTGHKTTPDGNDKFRMSEPFIRSVSNNVDNTSITFKPFTSMMAAKLDAMFTSLKKKRAKKRDRPLVQKLVVRNASDEYALLTWQEWQTHITWQALYRPGDFALVRMLNEMRTSPIDDLYVHDGGTQLKLVFFLENEQRVVFKPMRFPRSQETLPDHMYFSDYERHHAEIAAFHLDTVLDFYRVPPTIARFVNVTRDVKRLADKNLLKTFFVSPAGNICFHGECDYYCDTGHAVCGRPELLEGSMQAFLPSSTYADRKTWRHPWRRSYHKRKKVSWESDNKYCSTNVRNKPPYNEGRRLLDLMDLAVFDFLTGNMDRHHYETFTDFGNYTFLLHLDNGRAFGKAYHDEMSILAPIYQCCLMRLSTLKKLLRFFRGPTHLSDALRQSLSTEVAQPILLEQHFQALDRRVQTILRTVFQCATKHGKDNVIIHDDF